jgi:GGDEF domain-containing protein
MKRMRFLVATLVFWFLSLTILGGLGQPVAITDLTYALLLAIAVVIILVPGLTKIPLWALIATPILAHLAFMVWLKPSVLTTSPTVIVTEICALISTIILARSVSMGVSEFESTVAHITLGGTDNLPESLTREQDEIYREVRRARNHQRPLTLMAIRVDDQSIKTALDRMVQETQQSMMKHYALSGVFKALCGELEDYNIIAKYGDHFLVLMPEATPDKLPHLIQWLRRTVFQQVGVTLQIGTASLPEDALTYESLVEKAVQEMSVEPMIFVGSHNNVAANS